jgi:hypothetical protein
MPFAAISSCRAAFCAGYVRSMPVPITATVRPSAASAAVCAAVSMPAASPLMTGMPLAARPVAIWRAWWMDHPEVGGVLAIEDADQPDACSLPPLEVAGSFVEAICLCRLK